jgi:hypothetical protein
MRDWYKDEPDDDDEMREYKQYMMEELARMNTIMEGIGVKVKALIDVHFQKELNTLSAAGFRQLENCISHIPWSLSRDVGVIIDDDFYQREKKENSHPTTT